MSNKAYSQSYQAVPMPGNPRYTEAWALTQVARRMKEGQNGDDFPKSFLDAVRLNWRLWTIFQAEISSPESSLPEEVRINMLRLANFVDKTSVAIIADPTADKADVLININREIAAGLFTDPETGQSQEVMDDMEQPEPSRVFSGQ